ncbi:MAG: hypothetical protein ACREI9_15420 [Nitrospiraceae bacterium]
MRRSIGNFSVGGPIDIGILRDPARIPSQEKNFDWNEWLKKYGFFLAIGIFAILFLKGSKK